ncbi:MAG TPA: low molecular weight protein-tyrosine-phosphatase [Gammaproteobacteria bacterium]|nr:low molecular weight protein-tyrosine-phosphatase [Gammaproteobacteria bacterium]
MSDYSVLFVCMGNICRSPTAEGVFRRLHLELAPELRIHADSAGTHAYHIGEPPDGRSQAAARARGVDISGHRGRQVRMEDFLVFDYVLAMDAANLRRLQGLRPRDARAELRLLLEYAPDVVHKEVPDPYYGGSGGFEEVLDLVEQGGRGLLAEILRRARTG